MCDHLREGQEQGGGGEGGGGGGEGGGGGGEGGGAGERMIEARNKN